VGSILAFGAFEIDQQSGELRKHGRRIRLADQPLQILLLLLERPDHVVTREDIRQRLWPGDTFVDFDTGMSSAMRKLRDALGDSADKPRFIETVPRRGYRFIAPVKPAAQRTEEGPASTMAIASTPGRVRLPWMIGGLAAAAAIAALVWYERGPAGRLTAGAVPIRSIAVLPFENLTGDQAQDYFVDGLTDVLTTDLAQVDGLQVISRTSAMQYKHTKKRLPVIGQELTVDGIVEGSIARSGDHLRISVQLVQAATDRNVWARNYEDDVRNIVAVQGEIARAIAGAIGAGGGPSDIRRLVAPKDIDPQAYDAYLKGLSVEGRDSVAGLRTAVAYFEEAVAKQPDFATGHAALAQARLQFLFAGPFPPREIVPNAEAAARKALQLDDTVALAHRVLGQILHDYYWQWDEGDKELHRASDLDRNSVEAHTNAAFSLARNKRFDEALAEVERARALDPLSFAVAMNLASALRMAGQYEHAIAGFRSGLELNPRSARGHFQLGVTFVFMERLKDAIDELETTVRLSPDNARFKAYLAYAYARAGRRADARKILSELKTRAKRQYISSFGIALIHDALGERERALAAFERAYEEHAIEFAQPNQYLPLRTLSGDPRYETLARRVSRAPAPHGTGTTR
jgi:TolB-like protein/DNA-binding winged helix-turn-helix (wHTH) protein/tetratricopeptide (TPR) repeat protein